MIIKQRNKITEHSTLSQVLLNRGIPLSDIKKYSLASMQDVSSPLDFGGELIKSGIKMLINNINKNAKTLLIVDCDVDGNVSSAVLLNYLHNIFPSWTENQIDCYFHSGKQHGLNDCIDYILKGKYEFVLCPDAGSNDSDECKKLKDLNVDILILDHHDFDKPNPYALIINNQTGYTDYPNKALSGVGVVWQFCRAIDEMMNVNYADKYLDLVAIGLVGDMMDIRSIETKALIQEGLKKLSNPYLYYMAQKNAFKLGSEITPIGAAFYIVPLLNAIQRSGTQEEKELVFNSMLEYKAFIEIPSTKRGHKPGELEKIVTQAVRISTNVKNRQTRVQDAALESLENKIETENLLNHKVLLLLLESNSNIPSEIRGLIANKFMAKYQRPCCLLTKDEDGNYSGSARGCSIAGVTDFKQLCLDTGVTEYAVGHPNAFGLQIKVNNIQTFIDKTDIMLKDMSDEAIYWVDYLFEGQDCNPQVVLDIAKMSSYWGSELDESLIGIKGLKVTANMVDIYNGPTIKISLNNGINIMKFNASEELCDKLKYNNNGFIELDIVGNCNANEWNGEITPQIFIKDFNIIDSSKYYF